MKLHGIIISNYYCVTKLALLEKGISFDEVQSQPSQEDDFLAISPMGKIPVLETDQGHISESLAILQYLEKLKPEPALFPSDPFQAGRAYQIHQFIDLYIDGPARTLLRSAFFGAPHTPEQAAKVVENVTKGVKALSRIIQCSPYANGNEFSHADLAAYMTLPLARDILMRVGQPNPLSNLAGIEDYLAFMGERPHVKAVTQERNAAIAAILAQQS